MAAYLQILGFTLDRNIRFRDQPQTHTGTRTLPRLETKCARSVSLPSDFLCRDDSLKESSIRQITRRRHPRVPFGCTRRSCYNYKSLLQENFCSAFQLRTKHVPCMFYLHLVAKGKKSGVGLCALSQLTRSPTPDVSTPKHLD
ncbi:hypothetical protein EVAR_42071_1 [Eumeta japonica]|uniref:Uncharacterized protein n=1 Tax=Eumeta variegata TaxID=151549 RepID=A0A4C1XVX4_EUMVA|nr:hypothetical protein EVAR_42071_1 [Eumeta japonica]